MWMLLRVPKMYDCIFGFQRCAWWPKWEPASSSWRMVKSGRAMVFVLSGSSAAEEATGARG